MTDFLAESLKQGKTNLLSGASIGVVSHFQSCYLSYAPRNSFEAPRKLISVSFSQFPKNFLSGASIGVVWRSRWFGMLVSLLVDWFSFKWRSFSLIFFQVSLSLFIFVSFLSHFYCILVLYSVRFLFFRFAIRCSILFLVCFALALRCAISWLLLQFCFRTCLLFLFFLARNAASKRPDVTFASAAVLFGLVIAFALSDRHQPLAFRLLFNIFLRLII